MTEGKVVVQQWRRFHFPALGREMWPKSVSLRSIVRRVKECACGAQRMGEVEVFLTAHSSKTALQRLLKREKRAQRKAHAIENMIDQGRPCVVLPFGKPRLLAVSQCTFSKVKGSRSGLMIV